MVVLAVNGDYMFGATDNGLPDIIKGIAIASNPVLDLNDMLILHRLTSAVYAMQDWIDQQSGGAATYNILASGDKYDCKHYGQNCNTLGLTDMGKFVMKELMKKGMIIDVGHIGRSGTDLSFGGLSY